MSVPLRDYARSNRDKFVSSAVAGGSTPPAKVRSLMRKASSPAPQTARFIAKILASRPTSVEEVPMLVAGLGNTLGNLLDPQPENPQAEREAAVGVLDRLAAAVD